MLRYEVGQGYKPSSPLRLPRSPSREACVPEAKAFLGVLSMKQLPCPQVQQTRVCRVRCHQPSLSCCSAVMVPSSVLCHSHSVILVALKEKIHVHLSGLTGRHLLSLYKPNIGTESKYLY